jgi:hypothetical protein
MYEKGIWRWVRAMRTSEGSEKWERHPTFCLLKPKFTQWLWRVMDAQGRLDRGWQH